MLLFFLLCGRYFDHAMRQKTRAVAGNLAALKADMAHRFEGSEVVIVPAAALRPGDRVLVRPGDRVPADGVVINGIIGDRRKPGDREKPRGAPSLLGPRSMPAA